MLYWSRLSVTMFPIILAVNLLIVSVFCAVPDNNKVRTEQLVVLFELTYDRKPDVNILLAEVLKEVPGTRWTVNEIASIVRKVESSSTVPVWFHQVLASFDQVKFGHRSYKNLNLVNRVKEAAPSSAVHWRDERFVKFVIRQWLEYCVGPLQQYNFPWVEHPCSPTTNETNEIVWRLTSFARSMMITEMSILDHDREFKRMRGESLPPAPPEDVDILALY